jgi:hypothetical protein
MLCFRLAIIIIFSILVVLESQADSLFNRRLPDGRLLFDSYTQKGIDRQAINLIFRMFDFNQGRIENQSYALLVDFSLPSVQKRMFLLNLINGQVESFLVSHGINSGVLATRKFSNFFNSWQSSLGFYYAQGSYISEKNGLSLALDGVDKSNSNARLRGIVLHGAKYATEEFIRRYGRLGWSEGCFAVDRTFVEYLVGKLSRGSILLAYHRDLMALSRQYPDRQNLSGEETIPPGVNRNRAPYEGGSFVEFEQSDFASVL